jgi:hypothetical protein
LGWLLNVRRHLWFVKGREKEWSGLSMLFYAVFFATSEAKIPVVFKLEPIVDVGIYLVQSFDPCHGHTLFKVSLEVKMNGQV